MIYNLKLIDKFTNGILHYIWTNEDCLNIKNLLQKGIEFKDGLNILVGKNGSGKSTILNIIRYFTFCKGGFNSEKTFLRIGARKCFELIPSLEKDKKNRIESLEELKI